MSWLKEGYGHYRFFQERDIVWTLHLHLLRTVEEMHLSYNVYSGHRMTISKQISADLVILAEDGSVDVVAEFKYEPSHRRTDFAAPNAKPKWPVVEWKDVEADVARVKSFVTDGSASTGYAVFIDEGGYFRWRQPPPGSEWRDWPPSDPTQPPVSILWSKVETHAPSLTPHQAE
jgi:hypothetical protein